MGVDLLNASGATIASGSANPFGKVTFTGPTGTYDASSVIAVTQDGWPDSCWFALPDGSPSITARGQTATSLRTVGTQYRR